MLYWCGISENELIALALADFDFERKTASITKSYQLLKDRDVITTPKTPIIDRVINMSPFLCDDEQTTSDRCMG